MTKNRAKYIAAWRKANPEKRRLHGRKAQLKTLYGLSLEEYTELLLSQDGKCLVCGNTEGEPGYRYALAVDHAHETGEIRGLLCQNCNRGIGMFKDNPDLLRRAAEYLETR